MELTIEQTTKIFAKLKDYGMKVVDMDECPEWVKQPAVTEEYFREKVNDALISEDTYTTEDLETDIDWLEGQGLDREEAEKFMRSTLNKTLQEE